MRALFHVLTYISCAKSDFQIKTLPEYSGLGGRSTISRCGCRRLAMRRAALVLARFARLVEACVGEFLLLGRKARVQRLEGIDQTLRAIRVRLSDLLVLLHVVERARVAAQRHSLTV